MPHNVAASAAPQTAAPAATTHMPEGEPRESTAASSIVDEPLRPVVSALLAELRRDAELVARVDSLDARLTPSLTHAQFAEILSSLTEMVGQRIKRIEHAKQEMEILVSHMVGRLDEMGQFVAEQTRSQSQSQASSETLKIQLAGEMQAMGESVESASDLQQMRVQVRSRLDSIDRHLQEFREREASLASEMQARSAQMRARITELEAKANRLHIQLQDEQRLSTMDALTRIPNRLAYEKRMEEELKRFQRFRHPTCLAIWDVDHFKRVNDTYGHRAGDRVLQAVAECLAGRIRGTDFVARYGGEEFVMILPGISLEDVARVVDQWREAISTLGFHFRGTPVTITVSSGVTALIAGDSPGAAFDRADKALYRAKEAGRNRCVTG